MKTPKQPDENTEEKETEDSELSCENEAYFDFLSFGILSVKPLQQF